MAIIRGPEPRHPMALERRLLTTLQPRIDYMVTLAGRDLTFAEFISTYRQRYPAGRDLREIRSAAQIIIDNTRSEVLRTASFGASLLDDGRQISSVLEAVTVNADDIIGATVRALDKMLERFALGMDIADVPVIRTRIIRGADILASNSTDPPSKELLELALDADDADDAFRRSTRDQGLAERDVARARIIERDQDTAASARKAREAREAAEKRLVVKRKQTTESREARARRRNKLRDAAFDAKVKRAQEAVKDAKNDPVVVAARKEVNANRARKRAERKAAAIAREEVTQARAKATKELHAAIDVREYEWITKRDLRVRDLHRSLHGRIFKWSDPPPDPAGYPGQPYNCRCIARPVRRTSALTSRRRAAQRRGRGASRRSRLSRR